MLFIKFPSDYCKQKKVNYKLRQLDRCDTCLDCLDYGFSYLFFFGFSVGCDIRSMFDFC